MFYCLNQLELTPAVSSNAESPAAPPPSAEKFLLDDTSIAALPLPNGDRRLFFQDRFGNVR